MVQNEPAPAPPAPVGPPPEKRLGVGYEIGNGQGFVGADVIYTCKVGVYADHY